MKFFVLALLLLLSTRVFAQETRSFTLKPIEMAPGPRYFYGGQRLSGDFTALEVPFLELRDEEVFRLFRNAKRIRTAERVVALVPLGFLLFNGFRNLRPETLRTYYWVVGSSIVVDLGLAIARNGVVRRAVLTYNQRLPRASFGASVQPLPLGGVAPGLGVQVKF